MQTVPYRRRSGIWLVDDHVAVLVGFVDNCTDASIALAHHHLEVFILLFRNIDGVRIKCIQHGIYSGSFDAVYRKGVHVRPVEFLDNCILDFSPLPELEILGLCGGRRAADKDCRSGGYYGFCLHIHFSVIQK